MAKVADRLLTASNPRVVARAAVAVGGDAVGRIEDSLPGALAGRRDQVRIYVDAYRALTESVLEVTLRSRPDVAVRADDGRVVLVAEAKRHGREGAGGWVRAALEREAMSTPFSGWVGTLGVGQGTAGAVAASVRAALPGIDPLAPPNGHVPDWQLDDGQLVRFSRAVLDELAGTKTPLDHIADVLGLTQTELAALFGVRRQAVDQWMARGVPAERQEKLATLGEIADLLSAKLKSERIPGVVRRAAAAYGERSALDAIAAGDEERVLAELRDAFDWAAAA
jgi:transcriptional regulator with XRE-family HTH domain